MPQTKYSPVLDRLTIANPAAGANWTFTNVQGERLLVRYVLMTLVTSAAAANRVLGLQVAVDGTPWARFGASAVQVTGLTRFYCAYPGSSTAGDSAAAIAIGWPSDGLLMEPGDQLSSVVSALDVGDQLSAISLRFYRLPEAFPLAWEPMSGLYQHNEQGA